MNQTVQQFIDRIRALQSDGDPVFPKGLFPAQRINPLIGYRRDDTTMFFSAIICFTLRSIRRHADIDTQACIDAICDDVTANYPAFQNKDGLKTYNFWRTKPSKHFPNGHIFRHFEHFRIPDDIDDTAFVYLTAEPTEEELLWLKNKLTLHANGAKQRIRNTYPEYQSLPAYSTWFGKDMYIEFDVGVLSNMLYCILHYRLPWNHHDDASLEYIRSVIATRRYLNEPFRCAHQYPRTPLIVYHVARLMAAFDPPALREVRAQLVTDTQALLTRPHSRMDEVLLAGALTRLGVDTRRVPVETFTSADFRGFYFFIAGLLTAYEHPLLYGLSYHPLVHMHWICEAHCWTLLAEYETLWTQHQQKRAALSSDLN